MDELDEEFMLAALLLLMLCASLIDEPIRRWWVRPINGERNQLGAFATIFQEMKSNDPEMFFKYTRMYPSIFDRLLAKVKPKLLKRSRRESLSPELRLAMTLKFLAHGGSFLNLSWEFRVGRSTVSSVVLQTCKALWEVLCPVYLKPPSTEDWLVISSGFQHRWNFPNTLGAIDGKHVRIQCPRQSGSQYYNYKQYFSLVLLACCDAEYKFIWADIGAYGSENDAGIFRRSVMGQMLEQGAANLPAPTKLPGTNLEIPHFFVGDEAFPLKDYLMRPYPGKYLGEMKNVFNYRLSRARRTIENTFGILASRWRVYRQPLCCSVKTTEAIVKATLCLHNFLRTEATSSYTPPSFVDSAHDNGEIVQGEWREIVREDTNFIAVGRVSANTAPNRVYELRDSLANYLVSPAGSVSWQNQVVSRGR